MVFNHASHLCDPGLTLPSGHMQTEFLSMSTWLREFFFGYSGFLPSSKSASTKLYLAGFGMLWDHTWIVWQQPWAPSHVFGLIPFNLLILKSPCRERSLSAHIYMTHLSMLSRCGGRPGVGGGFDITSLTSLIIHWVPRVRTFDFNH